MSASSGAGGMQSGGIMQMIQNFMMGGQKPGTVVGQETPEWEFPMGADRVPDDIRNIFLRSDAGPTGLNEFIQQEMQKNPGIIDRLRSMINMGIMRPKNAAAQNITTGYGGYRAGDQTPLGPLINGMPSGLNESQLNTLANIIGSGVQYNLGLIEQSGYLDGMPTLERDRVMGELAQGWMEQAISQFRENEVATHNRATENLDQQRVTNDNIQTMADIFGGQMVTDPATGQSTFQPTEEARQFNTTESGYLNGQATLTREQQAFNQAKDVANLMSNPRNYMEAQMLQNARGGLTGMQPNNQVQQTTFGPATTANPQMGGAQQFQSPGGQFNQLPNLSTMQGGQQEPNFFRETAQGGQQGQGFNTPTPQGQAATGQMNLSNPQQWSDMLTQAGGQWGTAQQGLNAVRSNPAWGGMMPQAGQLPGGIGAGPAPWPGLPTGTQFRPPTGAGADEQIIRIDDPGTDPQAAQRKRMLMGGQPGGAGDLERGLTVVDDSNWTPEQRAQWAAQQQAKPMPNIQQRMAALGQPSGLGGDMAWLHGGQAGPAENGASITGGMQGLPSGQAPAWGNLSGQFGSLAGLKNAFGQAGAGGVQQARQPGAGGQNVAAANGPGTQYATSNFTQSLLQNRVVPKTGGLAVGGQKMTMDQMKGAFNPNKVRTQDYLRGENSQQANFRSFGSAVGGYSDEDLTGIMQKNLPSFKAPTAGRMI